MQHRRSSSEQSPYDAGLNLFVIDFDRCASSSAEEVQKRIKAVSKKLRQAESLAEEEQGGKELNVDQKGKIESIPGIQEELKELNDLLTTLS